VSRPAAALDDTIFVSSEMGEPFMEMRLRYSGCKLHESVGLSAVERKEVSGSAGKRRRSAILGRTSRRVSAGAQMASSASEGQTQA
jgi:hypothetical protein